MNVEAAGVPPQTPLLEVNVVPIIGTDVLGIVIIGADVDVGAAAGSVSIVTLKAVYASETTTSFAGSTNRALIVMEYVTPAKPVAA